MKTHSGEKFVEIKEEEEKKIVHVMAIRVRNISHGYKTRFAFVKLKCIQAL